MPRDPRHDILFEPVRIGPKTMRNRFYQTPHCIGFGAERPGSEAYLRAMKAEGGWAVVNTEAALVSPEDDYAGFSVQTRVSDDRQLGNLALLAERAHEHGALAGLQLLAMGRDATGMSTRQPGGGPSGIISDSLWWAASYEMDRDDIRELLDQYVAAALRARRAGFDIVNIAGAEGAGLPLQFLMARHNHRSDEYGGSFRNRARLWLEVLERVREAVGEDCAVTTRFCIDTLHGSAEGIRAEEEGAGFVELADHLVDFWDVQVGGETLDQWVRDAGSSRFYPEDFQGRWVRAIRPYTRKPIVGVGRFTNPDTMAELVRSGRLDIIGAARPSIADPFLPRKIEEGRLEDIRECIGCNVCISRVNAGAHIVCTQNPTLGEEYRRGWHPERFSKARNSDADVLVVGAGPAGMECAITLGRRGMRNVHLVEAAGEVGGHFRWVPRLPGLAEWGRVVDWRKNQLGALDNVSVVTGTALDANAVLDYGADIVVCATGSRWATNGLNGPSQGTVPGVDAALPWVLTPEQIMVEDKPVPDGRVIVYDCETYFVGVSLAERLARTGRRVTLITPMAGPALYMGLTGEAIEMLPLLAQLGVEIVTGHLVTSVGDRVVHGRLRGDRQAAPVQWDTDALILTTQRVAENGMYRALKADPDAVREAGITGLHQVGDCRAPRQQVADAIFDGHRLAREIDSENPRWALPYVPEDRILDMTDAAYDAIVEPSRDDVSRSTVLRGS